MLNSLENLVLICSSIFAGSEGIQCVAQPGFNELTNFCLVYSIDTSQCSINLIRASTVSLTCVCNCW